jgi:type IV secretory pathway VirB2 component (pilin)
MSHIRSRAAVVAAAVISAVALSAGAASAAPACSDPVANAIHTVHETVGDPTGAGHAIEDAYCGVKP